MWQKHQTIKNILGLNGITEQVLALKTSLPLKIILSYFFRFGSAKHFLNKVKQHFLKRGTFSVLKSVFAKLGM